MNQYLVEYTHWRSRGSWSDIYLILADSEEEALKIIIKELDVTNTKYIKIIKTIDSAVTFLYES